MKTIIFIIISLIFSLKIQAQTTIATTTISVKGNCDQCKERIENAADIKGVKNAKWDEKNKIATVTYDTKKVTLEQIEKAIAHAGYETASQKANEEAYKNLPSCCKYQTGDCKKK
ncbi:MAG: heavy-metal-associated domain-containing protein [Burkholderiales bacterium]|nr:heavy-metal-associated domain-containing protein [Bacteroidia bacterium]